MCWFLVYVAGVRVGTGGCGLQPVKVVHALWQLSSTVQGFSRSRGVGGWGLGVGGGGGVG